MLGQYNSLIKGKITLHFLNFYTIILIGKEIGMNSLWLLPNPVQYFIMK